MTFAIYAFCSDDAPPMTNESLAVELRTYFRDEKNFRVEFEQLPFEDEESLALFWDKWLVRISYEEGESVEDEVRGAQLSVAAEHGARVAHMRRMIRAVFGTENDKVYTNQIIYVMEFLKNHKGAVLYDPQQANFVDEI